MRAQGSGFLGFQAQVWMSAMHFIGQGLDEILEGAHIWGALLGSPEGEHKR